MSVLLFIVGAIVVMIGVGMVGYGIPINEFSFGNTLIVAGTTAVVGGLIVIAIGVAVGQLRRINQCAGDAHAGTVRPSPLKCSSRRPGAAPSRFRSRPNRNPSRIIPEPKRPTRPPSKTTRPLPRRRSCEIRIARPPRLRNSKSRNTRPLRSRHGKLFLRRRRSNWKSQCHRRPPTMFFRWPECARSRLSMRHGILRRRRHRRSANLSQAISTPCGRRKSDRRNVRSSMRPSRNRNRM